MHVLEFNLLWKANWFQGCLSIAREGMVGRVEEAKTDSKGAVVAQAVMRQSIGMLKTAGWVKRWRVRTCPHPFIIVCADRLFS
jgi:hypothetical protein